MISFLSKILPEIPAPQPDAFGFYGVQPCYFSFSLSDGHPVQVPCFTVEDLANAAQQAGADAYFALASYKDPAAGRKATNAYQIKCLWADLDAAKPGAQYASQADALKAVKRFAKATGLTPSALVASGMGLHVYWVLSKVLSADEWRPLAKAFHIFCSENNLSVDPARAEDAASVLRVPGTVHSKSGRTVTVLYDNGPVCDLDDLRGRLAPYMHSAVPSLPGSDSMHEAFVKAGIADPVTAKAKPIVMGCAHIKTMGLQKYPTWFAAMSVLRRCTDGLEWAHKLSAMDAERYDSEATESKFYAASPDAPALCSTFETLCPGLCEKSHCPYRGTIKTPVEISKRYSTAVELPVLPEPKKEPALVTLVSEAALPDEHLPDGKVSTPDVRIALKASDFLVDDRGCVQINTVRDKDGSYHTEERVICSSKIYYLYEVDEAVDKERRKWFVFDIVHKNGKSIKAYLSSEDCTPTSLSKWMYANSIFPALGTKGPILMDFINSYLRAILDEGKDVELKAVRNFGWVVPKSSAIAAASEEGGFISGRGRIDHLGLHPVSFEGAAKQISESMQSMGTLEQWKYIPMLYRVLDQKIGQLVMCLSFAAPFMQYGSGEATNGLLSLWSSESGLGKTSMLRAAASVWGDPYNQFISREASPVARARRLGTLRNLPAFMDEVTDVSDEDMYGLAYTIVGGKEKDKLKSSGDEYVNTSSWKTMTFTTANRSFREAVSSKAGDSDATLKRIMEYRCDFKSYEKKPKVNAYITQTLAMMHKAYGLAGPELMYQIMRRADRLATLESVCARWVSDHGFMNSERFMAYPLAVAMQVGRWCVEFGLLDYDMDALEKWVIKVFAPMNRMDIEDKSFDCVELIGCYLTARQAHTLTVANRCRNIKYPDPGIKGAPDPFILAFPQSGIVHVRMERDSKALYISIADLAIWSKTKNVSITSLVNALAAKGIPVKVTSSSLTAGISWLPASRERNLVLHGASLDALGISLSSDLTVTAGERDEFLLKKFRQFSKLKPTADVERAVKIEDKTNAEFFNTVDSMDSSKALASVKKFADSLEPKPKGKRGRKPKKTSKAPS